MRSRFFIRKFDAWSQLEVFLVAAVSSILAIRLYLELAGYPQLGGRGLHIAHMLWGGLFMLAAIVILFSFLSKASERLAAILAGIGFGTFIDEIGKFVTADNDYFFRPAVALMYIAFVLTFLSFHMIHSRQRYSSMEYLMNALHEMEEVALHDIDEEERTRALQFLEQSDPGHPLTGSLKSLLLGIQPVAPRPPNQLSRLRRSLAGFHRKIATAPWFSPALVLFFVGQLALKLIYVVIVIFFYSLGLQQLLRIRLISFVAARVEALSFVDWAQLLSWLLSGVFVLLGVIRIRQNRIGALRMFERSILVSIFLTQVFSFYIEEFSALVGLFFNIAILIALRYMIEHERTKVPINRRDR